MRYYAAAFVSTLPSITFEPVLIAICRGFFASGISRTRSTCRRPFSKRRALDLHEIGKLEDALEGARRDAPIKGLAGFLFGLGLLVAADGEGVFLKLDIELGFG